MGPLLSSKFVRPVTVGIMDEEDFETVRMEAQPFRPLARCKKNIRSRKVIISPDCVFLDDKHRINTFGDTLSIEVKPKLGYHGGEFIILGYHYSKSVSLDLCKQFLAVVYRVSHSKE